MESKEWLLSSRSFFRAKLYKENMDDGDILSVVALPDLQCYNELIDFGKGAGR